MSQHFMQGDQIPAGGRLLFDWVKNYMEFVKAAIKCRPLQDTAKVLERDASSLL